MDDVPACIHRGRILTGGVRCFCRHERYRRTVSLDLCAQCPLIEATGRPSPPIHAVAGQRPPTPEELPCVHRSAEPVRAEPCKTCSNHFGLRTIDVYGCGRHEECTLVTSEVMRSTAPHRLAKWCESCKDRTPSPLAPSVIEDAPHSQLPSPSS